MKFRIRVLGILVALYAALGAGSAAMARATTRDAQALYLRALEDIRHDGVESRRHAVQCLERATLLAPDSVGYQLALARLYLRMGFLGQARHRYERAARLAPDLSEAHLGQGLAWRRDYLKYLDRGSLARALDEFEEAGRLAPGNPEAWRTLVPLLVEENRLPEAMAAAECLQRADSAGVDGALAIGHVAYRIGQVERADSAFRAVLPRLPRIVRDRYLDIAPLVTEADTSALRKLPPPAREAFLARFWKNNDPDLGTAVNEAQLEYWSRVTQAYFLYFNSRRREWDLRGEIYVRYGPPQKADYNPVGSSLRFQMGTYGVFPMNVLVWSYPELGMTVPMQDRLLSEYYLPPISLVQSTDVSPDPDSLARRTAALATGGGRGVFPTLPPGVDPLPLDAVVARFEGDAGPRLLGWLESPGAPADSIWGDWVVIDSTGAEVARTGRPLSASACAPADLKAADFAASLPPGRYLVGASVRSRPGAPGARPRRGSVRSPALLESPQAELELSDVVVSCGAPDVEATALRLTADPIARIAGGEPLTAYFEIYHLAPGSDGLASLEFQYTVRSAERDPRVWIQRLLSPRPSIPEISATRREQQPGPLRRQFVNVPAQSLPPGRYRLEIRVRDLVSGVEAVRSAEFTRISVKS